LNIEIPFNGDLITGLTLYSKKDDIMSKIESILVSIKDGKDVFSVVYDRKEPYNNMIRDLKSGFAKTMGNFYDIPCMIPVLCLDNFTVNCEINFSVPVTPVDVILYCNYGMYNESVRKSVKSSDHFVHSEKHMYESVLDVNSWKFDMHVPGSHGAKEVIIITSQPLKTLNMSNQDNLCPDYYRYITPYIKGYRSDGLENVYYINFDYDVNQIQTKILLETENACRMDIIRIIDTTMEY